MSQPPLPNVPASVPRLSRPSRIPCPRTNAGTPRIFKSNIVALLSSAPPKLTSITTSEDSDRVTLATKLRTKIQEISTRQLVHDSPLPGKISYALDPGATDSAPVENTETKTATSLKAENDRDSYSQSATLVENESPRPQSVALFQNESSIVEPTPGYSQRRRMLLKRPFRVDKLRLFLKNTRIAWASAILLPHISPRIVVLDVLVRGNKMAITFATREEILAVEEKEENPKLLKQPIREGIGGKLRRARAIAMDENTNEKSMIAALEDILNEVETRGSDLDDWLLDEIEDVSAIYGELLDVDEVDMELILSKEQMRLHRTDELQGSWLFDEEKACVGNAWN